MTIGGFHCWRINREYPAHYWFTTMTDTGRVRSHCRMRFIFMKFWASILRDSPVDLVEFSFFQRLLSLNDQPTKRLYLCGCAYDSPHYSAFRAIILIPTPKEPKNNCSCPSLSDIVFFNFFRLFELEILGIICSFFPYIRTQTNPV